MTDVKHEIPRFDARLVSDVCGNKDVVMREAHDGLFVRYEDVQERIAQLTAERKPKCPDCNAVGMGHCSDPEHCGGVYWPDAMYRKVEAERDAALRECERLRKQHELEQEVATNREWWIARMKAPVSDEEWGKGCHLANRSHVNAIITSRSKPLGEKP